MYNNIKLNVQSCDGKYISPSFISLLGVRQGDNLSPTLFNIFVNDLPRIFDDTCKPVSVGNVFINCMLYADDLVIMSESNQGLQEAMNKLGNYCDRWGLEVNINKTKFNVSKKHTSINVKLIFKGKYIEMVDTAKYLGIEFSNDGNTQVAKSDLYNRALKACFKLTRALKPLPTPSTSLHLFDHLIKPILLYGSLVSN